VIPLPNSVVGRYLEAGEKTLDLAWVEGLRKDFLTLMKNLPRVKDYKDALKLNTAFNVYRTNFDDLFFEIFLNERVKYYFADYGLSEGESKYIDKRLRKTGWDFSSELSGYPISRADNYWSEEARFRQYESALPRWEASMRRKAQAFWKDMKEIVEWVTRLKPEGFKVKTPEVDKVELEGFKTTLRGYDPEDSKWHQEALDLLKVGLRNYRKNAASRLPWMLKHQLPLIIEFKTALDKGGEYNHNGTITVYASSFIGKKQAGWVTHVLAHEMGHHMYKLLDGEAQVFWRTAIRGDYGDLDLQELVDNWPGDAWAFQFPEVIGKENPVLALQVDSLAQSSNRKDLQKKEEFQKLLDEGVKTLQVPKTPITGYANKNPEESFCEAVGLLVSYGPRAVHEKIRSWLNIVIPGEIKLASEGTPMHKLARQVVSRFLQGFVAPVEIRNLKAKIERHLRAHWHLDSKVRMEVHPNVDWVLLIIDLADGNIEVELTSDDGFMTGKADTVTVSAYPSNRMFETLDQKNVPLDRLNPSIVDDAVTVLQRAVMKEAV
jgi:hypothetical protein